MLFGEEDFTALAFAEITETSAALSLYETLLEAVTGEHVFAIIMDPYKAAGALFKYHSTHGYISQAGDSPASRYFDADVIQALDFSRDMVGSSIGGLVTSKGRLILGNAGGDLDTMFTDYFVDGRDISIYLGNMDWQLSDFGTVFKGVMQSMDIEDDEVTINLRDGLLRLRVPIQTNNYAGSGNTEGGDDLNGKPKPLCYGEVYNITPILVSNNDLLYQYHDGSSDGVANVYDQGVALTFAADYATSALLLAATTGAGNDIEPGEYATCLAESFIRLGGDPSGQITADVTGDNTSTYVSDTRNIIERILTNQAGFDSSNLDNPSLAQLSTDAPSDVGIWIGTEQRTIENVIEELITGVGGFAGFNRKDEFQAGVFKAPSGAPAVKFDTTNIDDISIEVLPSDVHPPNWRRQVGYKKNYTVQTDLAGSVSDAQREFAANEYRISVSEDATVKTPHPYATDPPLVPALFVNQTDADTESARLLALYKDSHAIYRVKSSILFKLNMNDCVKVTYPRYGMDAGKWGRVVGFGEDAASYDAYAKVFI